MGFSLEQYIYIYIDFLGSFIIIFLSALHQILDLIWAQHFNLFLSNFFFFYRVFKTTLTFDNWDSSQLSNNWTQFEEQHFFFPSCGPELKCTQMAEIWCHFPRGHFGLLTFWAQHVALDIGHWAEDLIKGLPGNSKWQ